MQYLWIVAIAFLIPLILSTLTTLPTTTIKTLQGTYQVLTRGVLGMCSRSGRP